MGGGETNMDQCVWCGAYVLKTNEDGRCDKCWMEKRNIEKPEDPSSVYGLLLAAAMNKEAPPEYSFSLQGDLNQMGVQKAFLQGRGFDVKMTDVYPRVRGKDEVRALRAIWDRRIPGWWNYHYKNIKHGICTETEWVDRFAEDKRLEDMDKAQKEESEKESKKEKSVAAPLIDRKITTPR